MAEAESETTSFEDLFEKTKKYVGTRIELFRLKGINKLANILPGIILFICLAFLSFVVLILLSIGLAKCFDSLLGTHFWGYFIMAGIYIVLGFILFANRKRFLKTPLTAWLIKNLID
jgi:hypothetical protein